MELLGGDDSDELDWRDEEIQLGLCPDYSQFWGLCLMKLWQLKLRRLFRIRIMSKVCLVSPWRREKFFVGRNMVFIELELVQANTEVAAFRGENEGLVAQRGTLVIQVQGNQWAGTRLKAEFAAHLGELATLTLKK